MMRLRELFLADFTQFFIEIITCGYGMILMLYYTLKYINILKLNKVFIPAAFSVIAYFFHFCRVWKSRLVPVSLL